MKISTLIYHTKKYAICTSDNFINLLTRLTTRSKKIFFPDAMRATTYTERQPVLSDARFVLLHRKSSLRNDRENTFNGREQLQLFPLRGIPGICAVRPTIYRSKRPLPTELKDNYSTELWINQRSKPINFNFRKLKLILDVWLSSVEAFINWKRRGKKRQRPLHTN